MKSYHTSTAQVTVENYPYGYNLRTTLTHSLEFKSGKGFRHVTQTVNPKTGRLNNPKRGNYYPLMLLATDSETNYTRSYALSPNSAESVNTAAAWMHEHFHLFTNEQTRFIAEHLIKILKADAYARVVYCGSEFDRISPHYEQAVKALAEIASMGANLFHKVHVDTVALDTLKQPNFQPFTAVQ
jgi:hypothetical protein